MRRWNLGFPLEMIPPLCGRPCRFWISLYLFTHHQGPQGWLRLEWPDGQPLLMQYWPTAAAFQLIGDELARIDQEQARRLRKSKG